MPLAKIDPIETWYSVGSSLIGRVLLFFSAGWFGMGLGRIASCFTEWGDFLAPQDAFGMFFSGSLAVELLAFVFWPIAVFYLAKFPILMIVALLVLAVSFAVLIFSEEPAPIWWLVIAATISVCPVVGDSDVGFALPAWIVLAFFWTGLGCAGWWALRVYHPEVVEKVGDLMQGQKSETKTPRTPRRKAPPDTWGKPVKGWDGEDSADEIDDPES